MTGEEMQPNYLVSVLSSIIELPFNEYDEQGRLIRIYSTIGDRKESLSCYRPLIMEVIETLKEEIFAVRYLSDLPILICGVRSNTSFYLWGPIAFRYLDQHDKIKYSKATNHKDREVKELCYCNLERLLSAVVLASYFLTGVEYSMEHFLKYIATDSYTFPSYDSQMVEYIINREDTLMMNHTYVEEQVFMDKIRSGDVEGVKNVMKLPRHKYPLLFENNVMKNEEYMAVASVTMATRAAIEGGATSSECFAISDVYLKRIAKCQNIGDIRKNILEVHIIFAELVNKYQEHKSFYSNVEDCKKYIAQNLFKKISLSDIAKALQVNASYLSKVFSKSEGMTVSEYIQNEKVNAAKNLLKYSDRSVFEISEYLQFNSHSYFTSIFKRLTGITPQQYRAQNHPPEF